MADRGPILAVALAGVAVGLAGCTTSLPPFPGFQSQPEPAVMQAPPVANAPAASIPARAIVGRYGFASYARDADRTRTEAAARAQCGQKNVEPYVIDPGPNGGVVMLLADQPDRSELRLKGGPGGKNYIGPEGPAADTRDREIVSFDGKVLVLRWVDPEVGGRYGIGVYVRCGRA
jgi:hypothetical protein